MPNIATVLNLQLGKLQLAENQENTVQIELGGKTYTMRRAEDPLLCPVGSLSRLMFMDMGMGQSPFLPEGLGAAMSRYVFCVEGDYSTPMSAGSALHRLAQAMHSPGMPELTDAQVLQELDETRSAIKLGERLAYENYVSLVEGRCVKCGKPATSKCGRCQRAKYCGTECQRKDWKGHKKTCQA